MVIISIAFFSKPLKSVKDFIEILKARHREVSLFLRVIVKINSHPAVPVLDLLQFVYHISEFATKFVTCCWTVLRFDKPIFAVLVKLDVFCIIKSVVEFWLGTSTSQRPTCQFVTPLTSGRIPERPRRLIIFWDLRLYKTM